MTPLERFLGWFFNKPSTCRSNWARPDHPNELGPIVTLAHHVVSDNERIVIRHHRNGMSRTRLHLFNDKWVTSAHVEYLFRRSHDPA